MRTLHYLPLIALLLTACADEPAFDATGTFEATEVTLSSEVAGRIVSLTVQEGDTVAAGELIAQVDTSALYLQKLQLRAQSRSVDEGRPDISAQVAALRSDITRQQHELERLRRLHHDGAATDKQVDDAEAALRTTEKELAARLSTLSRSDRSLTAQRASVDLQVGQIDDRIARCRTIAPTGGTVLERYAEPGEMATVGRPLIRLADLTNVYLRAYVTSDQLADVRLGQHVRVTADFGGDRRFDYDGRVTWIAAESEFTPKGIQTRDSRANLVYAIKVAVRNDGRIKLGTYGELHLH